MDEDYNGPRHDAVTRWWDIVILALCGLGLVWLASLTASGIVAPIPSG